ncbi:MAG: ABC transporter permease [Kofleriaceae bacterium]
MIGLVLRRLGWTLVVAWFVVTATFLMATAIPSDPARAMLGPHSTEQTRARLREHYCLDRGAVAQYACWIGNVAAGDLGESYRTKRPVIELIGDRIWPTVQLALAAIVLQLMLGIPLGLASAIRRGRWSDHASNVAGLVALSAPTFVVGTLAMYVLAYRFGWFPISGYGEPGWDRLHHLVLPALTLAAGGTWYYARVTRSEVLDTLREDYIRTARAKGLDERTVILRHALRSSLGPLVTLIGLDLGALLGGAIIIESIFAWPGLGREVGRAIFELDLPLLLGVVLISAIAIAVANLIADLVSMRLDPRLRGGTTRR